MNLIYYPEVVIRFQICIFDILNTATAYSKALSA